MGHLELWRQLNSFLLLLLSKRLFTVTNPSDQTLDFLCIVESVAVSEDGYAVGQVVSTKVVCQQEVFVD